MSGATNLLLEGRLSWRLGRLLFSSEDLGLERLKLARSRERQRTVERVMVVFFQWLRAKSELQSPRRLTLRRARAARWELTQAELRLNMLTGGWFSANLPDLYPPPIPAAQAQPGLPQPSSSPATDAKARSSHASPKASNSTPPEKAHPNSAVLPQPSNIEPH
jgi:hypothetical protein